MAANKFGRYVWLIDLIRSHPYISFKEISEKWEKAGLGDGNALPWRTFMNHKEAVESIFNVIISCDPKQGYGYYIEDEHLLHGDGLRSWLIDSYATLNQVEADTQLRNRISFEKIPSGNTFLQIILQAMRQNKTIEVTHQGFDRSHPSTFEVEPYHVKVVQRRWYVIGLTTNYKEVRTYALDRMKSVSITDKDFTVPADFHIDNYFNGCIGIVADSHIPIETIRFKVYGWARNYLRTLPIHESQREIDRDDNSITYELRVRPTYDLYQVLLQHVDQIEILEPEPVKNTMCEIARNILKHYE